MHLLKISERGGRAALLQSIRSDVEQIHQDTLLSRKQQGTVNVLEYATICVFNRGWGSTYMLIDSKTAPGTIYEKVLIVVAYKKER